MNNLLIVTQKIDKKDPILGFFHGWVRELSIRFDRVTVICLQKGAYDLPVNVRVFSLGKEKRRSRTKYLMQFLRHIWFEKDNYDTVFVHMNQEYILIAGLLWRLLGKRVTMWRNHGSGNILTKIAVLLCDKVFCTSRHSYTARFKKTRLMPVGVDTNIFRELDTSIRVRSSILFLGRVAPVKRPDIFIEALKILADRRESFTASIYGDALPKDREYHESLKKMVERYGLSSRISFHPAVPNDQTVVIYNQHEFSVNLSPGGMYDKTIFEAALCGTIPVHSNPNLKGVLDERTIFEGLAESLAGKLSQLLALDIKDRENLKRQAKKYSVENHSLDMLADSLKQELSFSPTLIGRFIDLVFRNNLYRKYQKVYRYLISGGTAAAVDLVFLYFFTSILHIWYLFSAILAFLIAVVVSFTMHKFWTFADHSVDGLKSQAGLYLGIILTNNLGLNTLLMYVFVDFFHIHYLLSQIIVAGLIAIESFFVYKLFVFNKKP